MPYSFYITHTKVTNHMRENRKIKIYGLRSINFIKLFPWHFDRLNDHSKLNGNRLTKPLWIENP